MDTLKEARIEHETLLRTNPVYGLSLRMDELAMQLEPSLNQDDHSEGEALTQEIELAPMRIYMNIDRKSMELQKRIALLESQVSSLKEKRGEEYVIK